MAYKNDNEVYGTIAKWLHWSMSLLFLLSYMSVYYRHWFTERGNLDNSIALQVHLSVGLSLGLLVCLRIIWRLINPVPSMETKGIYRSLAKFGHYLLYSVMVAMPLTGYLGTGTNANFLSLFEVPSFENTEFYKSVVIQTYGFQAESFEDVVDYIHKDIGGKLLVWLLILGHAIAALYHHFILGDKTLKKMTTSDSD